MALEHCLKPNPVFLRKFNHFKLNKFGAGFVFSRLLTWRPVSGEFGSGSPSDTKEKLVSCWNKKYFKSLQAFGTNVLWCRISEK